MGRQLHLISDGSDGTHDLVNAAPDTQPGPERRAAAAEGLDRVEAALHRVLDVPIGTVRSRLARARTALRKAVEG